jgi:flavin reductase (DIM6/NTAB) family NADH-FMN oxidoreductase RutF
VHEQLPAEVPGVSSEALRQAMAEFATGVTVVTSHWQGIAHAMTATAFSSVSLSPPLVLVCVGKKSRFHRAVTGAGQWAVSILSSDQVALARRFSVSGRDLASQFDGVPHQLARYSGAPLLTGAQAWMDCVTFSEHDAGDHTIVVGRVLATGRASAATTPLTYHRGTYL